MSNDTASTVKTDNDNSNGEMNDEKASGRRGRLWPWGGRKSTTRTPPDNDTEDDVEGGRGRPTKWSMGVLNDPRTHEVPGSVLLLTGYRNEPLGLHNAPARTSHSSLPAQSPIRSRPNSRSSSRARTRPSLGSRRSSRQSARVVAPAKKTKETKNGAIILDPQPEESQNDPLNWPTWRRDAALLSLGFYCMLGGGMTPILAAGFNDISATFHVSTEQVALTTGLYMMGLGVGSVFFSPTAILWGKRPVYLLASVMFSASAIWCASATSFTSLLLGRIFQGIAVSPVECLPSATIAEIFFLHERAYRLGIYTLLLLGGKNLSPLASAAIIQSKGWRWVFWVLAIIVGACFFLLFFFVPETFWDRTPRPKDRSRSRKSSKRNLFDHHHEAHHPKPLNPAQDAVAPTPQRPQLTHRNTQNLHVGFSVPDVDAQREPDTITEAAPVTHLQVPAEALSPQTPVDVRSPAYSDADSGYFPSPSHQQGADVIPAGLGQYTHDLRGKPAQTFVQQLRPWNGRLHYDNWFRVSLRPFVLFAYPAVLWSAVVYACSIGWLIVLSESVSVIYRSPDTYNFSALGAGLVYISPFVGGVLGTAVAGKVSDVIVRIMARRNGGLYEPEFRLVMAAPVAVTTVIGLMGYGWSVEVRDQWIVPTVFFGVISFGCSLGSTTSITFCVDSYRQYAGEALVTLNFSKNVLHGLVFSLFFNSWLHAKGSKSVFIWLGVIQLVLLLGTVPMYIYGKRARMWTARRNLMEKL
ncbi:Major Facilitator Superfamily protein [Sporothrix brasiliensis 5110]|uniref:Major Facilitator Superfamily protein n=1 Tax=Sporothrix brasiliensis 5110 TaxID=1398154 RepID=A0A0C2IJW2_9PEZI|nr:Major Facilitator Superfamily protein [Sporothrix brasiliensis 5110]KIH87260.1 Major Facilitator Superfamily protein [Sporothrix brasiliensis 5110]